MWLKKKKKLITHFIRDSLHRRPIKTRKDILDKQRIQVEFDLLQFGFLRMERKCCGRGFAGFARASEEVEGEEFHCVFSLSSFPFFSRLLLLLLACLWDVRVGFWVSCDCLGVCVVFAVLVVVFAVRSSGLEIPIFTYLVLFFPGVGNVAGECPRA